MGSNCNLNCSYCHKEIENDKQISETFLNYLKTFQGDIIFRGGEPTLYINDIKHIVNTAKNATFGITTNGVNIENHIPFFTEHKFNVSVSYDGTNLRPFDPFTKKIFYPNINVTSVMTKNCNIFDILKAFDEKSLITGNRLIFYPHIAHYTNEYNKQYAMDETDYIINIEQIKECMNLFIQERKNYNTTNYKLYGIYRFLNKHLENNFTFGETVCANKFSKRVDVNGQQYNCLYIRDEKLNENWLTTQQHLIRTKFPKCEKCSVYAMCGGGCVKSLYHDKECNFYYKLFTWYKKFYNQNKEYL